MNISELTDKTKNQFASDLTSFARNGEASYEDFVFLVNRWINQLELNLTPFKIDWDAAPANAVSTNVRHFWYDSEGGTIGNWLLHSESKPATQVDIGQTWESRLDNYQVKVIEFGDDDLGHQSVCIKNVTTNKIDVLLLKHFLDNFVRVV